MTEIRFYKAPDPWGFFSNFSRHPLEIDGKKWPSSEHYFQSQKFVRTDPRWAEEVRFAQTCRMAADMGRSREHPIDPKWEQIKYPTMLVALFAKFTQHEDCKAMLLATGDAKLVEDTRQGKDDDHVWGDGSTGTGRNLLGEALMQVREQLRADNVEGSIEVTKLMIKGFLGEA